MPYLRALGSLDFHSLILVLVGFFMATFGSSSTAQNAICNEIESLKVGEYLHSQTDTQLSTLTLRNQGEPGSVGQAAVKGAMARRISGELSGMPVRWNSATLIGPILCAGLNAYKILVDPIHIRIVDGENRSVVQ
jgi:hypothetical protein